MHTTLLIHFAQHRHQDAEKAELPPFSWSPIPCSGMLRTV
jgi:hypothetical protein